MPRTGFERELVALSLLLLCPGCRGVEPTAVAPRVVLVTLDTLHVDWTGPYNGSVTTTPFLDQFASEGVRFEHAYAEVPVTLPSHASLLTGRTARGLGVLANGHSLPESATTLAEILRDAGYRTAGFVSLGVLRPSFGLDQGFEHYPDPFEMDSTRWYRTADEVFAPLSAWIGEHADEPFFVWAHFSDPHEPYLAVDAPPDTELYVDGELAGRFSLASAERFRVELPLAPGSHRLRWRSLRDPRPDDRPETALVLELLAPEPLATTVALTPSHESEVTLPEGGDLVLEFLGRLERPTPADVLPAYETEVAYVDAHLAKLDALLGSLGARETTLVAIVSDHGEGLFRHGWLGHAKAVYEDQLRVVWMMRGPGVPRGRRIVDVPAHLVDVTPTILDLLGLPPAGEGRTLAPCWSGGPCEDGGPWWSFAVDHEAERIAAMAGYRWPFKWIWERGFPRSGYDVASDPREERDLLAEPGPDNPEPLKRSAETFREAHRDLSQKMRRASRERRATGSDELLRSLGYLGGRRKE